MINHSFGDQNRVYITKHCSEEVSYIPSYIHDPDILSPSKTGCRDVHAACSSSSIHKSELYIYDACTIGHGVPGECPAEPLTPISLPSRGRHGEVVRRAGADRASPGR
jgi:hypothetical protein